MGERIAALEQRQSKLAKSGLSLESKEWSDEDAKIKEERVNIEKLYVYQLMNATTPGILKDSKKGMATALIACLTMALGGGFALVAPMLIMVLHLTKLTRLLTSSSFIFAVGVGLAFFIDTAEPKDIMASTATYAAVMVVSAGVGGET